MGDRAVADGISQRPSRCPDVSWNASEGQLAIGTPAHPDTWLRLRLYPIAKKLGVPFHPTFQVLRRSFSTHGTKEAHPTEMQAQLGHSDPRMTLNTYTRTLGPEVIQMVNQVTNRILGLAEKGEEAVQ
jgi:integrase